jgi:cation diffusion facilitator CzcD-associated flavoprotein CzcO
MNVPPAPAHEILIVGAGFAGLGMGIRLKKEGMNRFLILDEGQEVGGTWRDNRYPGAACDVESHLYSYSFAPNPNWTRTFSPQKEILSYIHDCVRRFGLGPHLKLGCRVKKAQWDDGRGVWQVEVEGQPPYEARVLINATGGLSRPALPDITGLANFRGNLFHSARWKEAAALNQQRVGIIGTGASALQIIPEVANSAKSLTVFQRTAHWVLPKRDAAVSKFERKVLSRFPALTHFFRATQYLLHESLVLGFVRFPTLMRIGEYFGKRYLKKSVSDPKLRRKLTPSFRMGCKRILLSNEYFRSLQRPNVDLITDRIEQITPEGVLLAGGRLIPLDALILATGFQAADIKSPYTILGRGGRDLNQAWHDGPEAYRGTTLHGFPNLFTLVGPNTGLGHSSMLLMIESQIQYITGALRFLTQGSGRSTEVRLEAQHAFQHWLQKRFPRTVWQTGCVSWYQMSNGRNTTLWPGTTFGFRWMLRRWDAENYIIREHRP